MKRKRPRDTPTPDAPNTTGATQALPALAQLPPGFSLDPGAPACHGQSSAALTASSAMASASVEMTAEGSSESWTNNQSNQIRLGNKFLEWIAVTDSALAGKWGAD